MRRLLRIMVVSIALILTVTTIVPLTMDMDAGIVAEAATKLSVSEVKAIKPSGFSASSYNYTKIKTKWDAIDGIDGYIIYRATSKDGTYTKVRTVEDPDKLYYINTGRTTGKTYYYKMRGYKKINGKTYYTKYSAVDSSYARPTKVKMTEVYGDEIGWSQVHVEWAKVTGATGYQIQVNQKKNGEWGGWKSYAIDEYYGKNEFTTYDSLLKISLKQHPSGYIEKLVKQDGKLVRVKKSVEDDVAASIKKTEAWIDVIQDESEYKFRVRAYHTEKGKKIYGLWSNPMTLEETLNLDEVVSALRDYTIKYAAENYPGFTYDDTRSHSTDQDSSYYIYGAFGGFSRYARQDDVIEGFKDNIDYYIDSVERGGSETGFLYARMSYPGDREGVDYHVSEGTYYVLWMLY